MGASTEMVRLDTLPKETVDKILEVAESGGGGITVITEENETLDKTYAEIHALSSAVLVRGDSSERQRAYLSTTYEDVDDEDNAIYVVEFKSGATGWDYIAESEDGYPVLSIDDGA